MIQRIQSLYLAIGGIIQIIVAFSTYYTFNIEGQLWSFTGRGVLNSAGENVDGDWRNTIFSLIAAGISIFTIFLYKDRKKQLKLTALLILIAIVEITFLGLGYRLILDKLGEDISIHFASILIPISLILFILARKAVKKDDELIRSVDRIR